MIPSSRTSKRILGITPVVKGFGFAVMEGERLVAWAMRYASGDKNAKCVEKAEKLMFRYRPHILALEDYWAKDSRRCERIRDLGTRLVTLARSRKIKIVFLSQSKIRQALQAGDKATKYDMAHIVAHRFPEELGSRLPPKRRPWMTEDSRMWLFEAVALTLTALA